MVMGTSRTIGWMIAALGALVIAGAFTWFMRGRLFKLVPVVGGLALAFMVARQIVILASERQEMLTDATAKLRKGADVTTIYSAIFGWGTWLMLAGAVLVVVGVIAGILRELDLMRGREE